MRRSSILFAVAISIFEPHGLVLPQTRMLIKSADDRSRDIETLDRLLHHPGASSETKSKIEQELRFMQSGLKGEADAAYEIDFHYEHSKNWVVIHDLRLEHGGRVAQIDHVLINRLMDLWVCESKRFGEGIAINDQGECSAFFNGRPYGIPSPFEQNRKHCMVLTALCDDGAVKLPTRLGFSIKPSIKSLILISKNARITRPKVKIEEVDDILKTDQIRTRIDKDFEANNNLLWAAKVVGSDTLEMLGRNLAALHRPSAFDWAAKFGLSSDASVEKISAAPRRPRGAGEASADQLAPEKKSKLICGACNSTVSYAVAKFCWVNKAKFGGNVYCMDCQKKVTLIS